MSTETLVAPASRSEDGADAFVTFTVAGQLFGVPVTRVQDILIPEEIAPVPGGPPEVRGLINLRERLAVYGGTLESGRTLAGGFRVTATIPWRTP